MAGIRREVARLLGDLAGQVGALKEISEGIQALFAQLEASEDRLTLALAASHQGLWDWDVVKDDTYLSPSYWELTGYTEGEIRPDFAFFLSIVHPDDRPMVEKSMREHLQGKSPESVIDYRMKRRTGEYVWTRGVGRVTARDDNGAPLRMVGVVYDITRQKRFEQEQRFLAEAGGLLSSSLDYEETLSSIATLAVRDFADWCGVDLVDEEKGLMRLKVVSADPAGAGLCARLEQLPPDRTQHHLVRAVIAMRRPVLLEHVTRGDIDWYAQGPDHLQALLALEAKSAIAVPMVRRDHALGALVFVSSTPSRVYGDADVRFAQALADRAALALENARLYRDSVRATQLRDHLLAVVAHDLRNPLSTILLQTAALKRREPRETGPDEELQKAREDISRAAIRMNRLIQDLVDVALVGVGELRVERALLSPAELVAEAAASQRTRAASSSVELLVDLEGDLPEVWGSRHRLLQVFENLIGNAIKFTAANGRITLGAVSKDDEVVFSVSDNGSGIEPDALSHVFDRFWQGARADRRGAGLGLFIARGIVEAHGGHIWVESTRGRGTTFSFSIPKASLGKERPTEFARESSPHLH